jgi:putative membrane protein
MTTPYEEYIEPRKLHPLTLVYRLFTNIPGLAIAFYFVVVEKQSDQYFYLILALIGLLLLVPSIVLNYIFFNFQITPKELVIRSGIIAKRQRSIPLEKIQNVNINQNFIQRILGLVKISIETAGDWQTEGSLEFVSVHDANEISEIIKNYKFSLKKEKSSDGVEATLDSTEAGVETVQDEKSNVIFELSWRNLIVYGMVRLRPLFLVFGLWLMGILSQFGIWENTIDKFVRDNQNYIDSLDVFSTVMLIIAAIFITVFLSWVFDILWTVNEYFKFKLVNEENKLVTSYGLLSKVRVTIPLRKLQQITILTNPLKEKLNFFTLTLQTAGFGQKSGSNHSVIPLAKYEELIELAQKIYSFKLPEKFIPISRKAIRRAFVRYLVTILFLIAPLIYFLPDLVWVATAIPLLYYAAYLRWLYRGYAINNEHLIVKQGFWIRKIIIIPLKKMQTLHLKESFFQRRLSLATIYFDNASSAGIADAKIADIDKEDAYLIYDEIYDYFKHHIKSNDRRSK